MKTKIALSVGILMFVFLIFWVFGGFNYIPKFMFARFRHFTVFDLCVWIMAISFIMTMVFDTIKSVKTNNFSLAKLFIYIGTFMLIALVVFVLYLVNRPEAPAPWSWKTTDVIAVYSGIMLLPFLTGFVLYIIKDLKE